MPERSVPSADQVFAAYARFESPCKRWIPATHVSAGWRGLAAWAKADSKTRPSAANKMLDALIMPICGERLMGCAGLCSSMTLIV